MKKRTAALGMLLLPLYILTACGVVFPGRRIVLPEAGAISKVTISGEGAAVENTDAGYIAELLEKMAGARDTGRASLHDRPLAKEYLRLDFTFRQGGSSTLFLYRKGNKALLEQPYQGSYRTDAARLDFLWKGA